MANEIINNSAFVLSNPALTKQMETIRKELNKAIRSTMTIAKALKDIKDRELWKDDYKDFVECSEVFGIKKAQAYKLIQGYEIYSKYGLEDFSNSQCVELVKLEKELGEVGVKSALESGAIHQTMTVKEIHDKIDEMIHPDKYLETDETDETATDETATDETATDETATDEILLDIIADKDGKFIVRVYSDKIVSKDIDKIRMLLEKYNK